MPLAPQHVMRTLAVVLVGGLVAGALAGCGGGDRQRHTDGVKKAASATPRWVARDAIGKRLWAMERKFYADRAYLPAWIDGDDPTPQLDALLETLRDAEQHGLDPDVYGYGQLAAAREKADEAWIGAAFEEAQIPELDLRLTYAFFLHAADMLAWRSSPRDVDRRWLPSPKKADLLRLLRVAIDENKVKSTFEGLAPSHPQYKGLQAAFLRARDGKDQHVDVERLRMNLERWRWAPRDLGDPHILINVPSYQMQVIDGGRSVLAMRVIVGAPGTPTPLFSDRMTYVVFSPYWNIPESILREETLPRVMDDPDYLARNNIEVVGTSGDVVDASGVDWGDSSATEGLRFRQTPGPDNALGLVKFIFPNHFNVYLHDTPTEALFNKERRTLSHGCIRIERPVQLAEYVLRDKTRWTPERIRAAMHSKREQSVTLKEPLPVHIGYWTAWVEEDGSVTFLDDPYGLDRRQRSGGDFARRSGDISTGRSRRSKRSGVFLLGDQGVQGILNPPDLPISLLKKPTLLIS
jgi:murein L,D-transpeptidase YcbB/YkuD